MTTPTTLTLPGSGFIANPLAWVIPASVQPSYLGVFGSSLTRTLQNGASIGALSGTVYGVTPTIAAAYATTVGYPQSGIQTTQLEQLNYTVFTLTRYDTPTPGSGSAYATVVMGDQGGSTPANTQIYYYNGGTSLSLSQKNSDATSQLAQITGLTAATWVLAKFTGTSGTSITAQNLTVGSARTVVTTTTTKTFAQSANTLKLGSGGGSSASNYPGTMDYSMFLFFPSVLSAGDSTTVETWCRNLAAAQGITV